MNNTVRRCCAAFCIAFAATVASAYDTPAQRALSARVPELLTQLDAAAQRNNVNAFALAIVDANGIVAATARGRTGRKQQPVPDAHTPFRLGSITKSFTALALVLAARDADFDLQTPLEGIAPPALFNNPYAPTQPLHAVHLLEHSAGFGELSRREWDWADPTPLTLQQGLDLDPSSRTSRWPPSRFFSYSNASPGPAAWLIEKLRGRPYEDSVKSALLTPLGMRDSGFFSDPRIPRGYKDDGLTEIPYWHQSIRAYGALNASAADMASFLGFLVNRGQPLLDERLFARMLAPRSTLAARSGLTIGYGLGVYGTVSQGHVFYGHGGDADGFLSRYGYLPDAQRAYFVVINADNPGAFARVRGIVERWLVRDLPAPTLPEAVDRPDAELRRYAGIFRPVTSRFNHAGGESSSAAQAEIRAMNGRLLFSHRGRDVTLIPTTNPQQFRRERDPVPTMVFVAEAGGLYLLGELGNFLRPAAAGASVAETTRESS